MKRTLALVLFKTSQDSSPSTKPKTEQYRLKTLMNVRKKPSMDADIVTTKPAGTLVRVLKVEDGWLHLIDGNYILFEAGTYAENA